MAKEWQLVEIDGKAFVPFLWRDPTPGGQNLGRAEFQVCLKFKRGKISEFWVYPVQTRMETCWHYSGGDVDFTISAYEGLKSEGSWMMGWCKEHKCTTFSVYAPTDAKFIEINYHGLSFWRSDVYAAEHRVQPTPLSLSSAKTLGDSSRRG